MLVSQSCITLTYVSEVRKLVSAHPLGAGSAVRRRRHRHQVQRWNRQQRGRNARGDNGILLLGGDSRCNFLLSGKLTGKSHHLGAGGAVRRHRHQVRRQQRQQRGRDARGGGARRRRPPPPGVPEPRVVCTGRGPAPSRRCWRRTVFLHGAGVVLARVSGSQLATPCMQAWRGMRRPKGAM